MKLKEYLDSIKKMVVLNPEILEYDVVYAADDEGNHFQEIHYTPSLGAFDGGDFDTDLEVKKPNAICIN